ncbi:HAD hydrolase family protein [Paenibacillus taichungensis]|uniref:HAD hydrolase family protein n=1 Tax=Paenibacillus taichungensis TaxID=484184 RepID=UPI0038D1422B
MMMKFVFDLDGTICFHGKPLTSEMVQTLDFLMEKGHELIFASARPIRDLLPILPVHMQHFPMVGGNGGFVYHSGLEVSTVYLEASIADHILTLLKQHEAEYLIDCQWDYCYSGNPEHPIRTNLDPECRAKNILLEELTQIVKVVVLSSRNHQEMLEALRNLPVVTYMHGTENIIDISPEGVNKWTGLQALGVFSHDFIAFGNDANDIPMFEYASRSICVGQHEKLAQIASERVESQEKNVMDKIIEIAERLEEESSIFDESKVEVEDSATG